jgi:uncharacterized protein
MKNVILYSTILLLVLFLPSCSPNDYGPASMPDNYRQQFDEWNADRLESLVNPTGWMRLAGLYWLEEGENTFGSSDTVDIRFPEGTIADYAGIFEKDGNTVMMLTTEEVSVTYEDERVMQLLLYDGEEALPVESGSLHWAVIDRGDTYGIRLYNKENPQVDEFTGFDRFDTGPEWYVKSRFIPNENGATIPIINVLGQLEDTPSPGVLEFMIDDEIYTLDALQGTRRLFLIVGDLTNQTETYQAGRYLYVDPPEEGSEYTVIDFNQLYNPPCSYNLYSTCQLPPPQNRLDVAIEAGEKRPVGWQGQNKSADEYYE